MSVIVLEVLINNASQLVGVGFDLSYDSSVVTPQQYSGQPIAMKGSFLNSGDATKDTLIARSLGAGSLYCSHTLVGDVSGVSGSGSLFYLFFERTSSGDPAFQITNSLVEAAAGALSFQTVDAIQVDVTASGMVDLYGVGFDLLYDSAKCIPQQTAEGTYIGHKGAFLNGGDSSKDLLLLAFQQSGKLYCSHTLLGDLPGVNGDGTLFTLYFVRTSPGTATFTSQNVLIEAASGNISLEVLEGVAAYDESISVLAVGIVNASETVEGVQDFQESASILAVGYLSLSALIDYLQQAQTLIGEGFISVSALIDFLQTQQSMLADSILEVTTLLDFLQTSKSLLPTGYISLSSLLDFLQTNKALLPTGYVSLSSLLDFLQDNKALFAEGIVDAFNQEAGAYFESASVIGTPFIVVFSALDFLEALHALGRGYVNAYEVVGGVAVEFSQLLRHGKYWRDGVLSNLTWFNTN